MRLLLLPLVVLLLLMLLLGLWLLLLHAVQNGYRCYTIVVFVFVFVVRDGGDGAAVGGDNVRAIVQSLSKRCVESDQHNQIRAFETHNDIHTCTHTDKPKK